MYSLRNFDMPVLSTMLYGINQKTDKLLVVQ